MTTFINCMYVALGGVIGSVSRYLLGLIPIKQSSGFPVITFIINVIGAFAIGLITGALQKNSTLNPQLVLLLKVGVCGGFTTFSTFSLEPLTLVQNGHVVTAALYIGASVLFGILAVLCGELLMRA